MIPIKFVPAELQASRVLIGQLGQYISHGLYGSRFIEGLHKYNDDVIMTSFQILRISNFHTL